MKKYFILCFFFLSCASGSRVMTQENFEMVEVGMKKEELKKIAGEPVLIKDLGNGEKQYEYIEKISYGGRIIEVKKYLFILKDGKITSKKVIFEDVPLFLERNSYEMQTSY